MNTAVAQKVQVPDIAAQVTYAMRVMGIAPIPRNYELFYEAYIGSNPKLTRELAALGSKASQEELDEIGTQYFGHHHGASTIDGVHTKIVGELEGLLRLLKQEQTSLESYNKLLDETYGRITGKNAASVDIIRNVIGVLTQATGDTISQGKEMVENVAQKSIEMDNVRKELDEYKRIANTDSLTQLSNRRAFDDKLSAIYNSSMAHNVTALILADIDHFKKINDTYGHPVGDLVLRTVADTVKALLRSSDVLVRAGGEEFLVIAPHTSAIDGLKMAEKLRAAIEQAGIPGCDHVTVSLGVAQLGETESGDSLAVRVNAALARAKRAGRNCVELAMQ